MNINKNLLKIGTGLTAGFTIIIIILMYLNIYQEVRRIKKMLTTYENNVYDISKFIESQRKKQKIMLAANGQLEPYWNMYKQHFKTEVFEILETLKVGELKDYDPDKFLYLQDEYHDEPLGPLFLKYIHLNLVMLKLP